MSYRYNITIIHFTPHFHERILHHTSNFGQAMSFLRKSVRTTFPICEHLRITPLKMKFLRPQGFSGPRDFFYKITTNKNNFNCKVSQTCLAKKKSPKLPQSSAADLVVSPIARQALGTGSKKTPFSSNISFISESFLFFNAENRQRIFATRAVG